MYHKAKDMLQKALQPKHGGYRKILERWHNDDKHRESLSKIGWTEEQIIQYEELALGDHSYFATREERIRNEKSWVLMLNKECVQRPKKQRPGFVEAKREMKRPHDEHVKETSEVYNDQDSEETNNSKDLKNMVSNRCPNRMEDLSFEVTGKLVAESNTFVLVNSLGTARQLKFEQRLELLAIFILV